MTITNTTSAEAPATPLPWEDLSSVVAERLRAAGIESIEEWCALAEQRFNIFGLTRPMVVMVDRAVAAARMQS